MQVELILEDEEQTNGSYSHIYFDEKYASAQVHSTKNGAAINHMLEYQALLDV